MPKTKEYMKMYHAKKKAEKLASKKEEKEQLVAATAKEPEPAPTPEEDEHDKINWDAKFPQLTYKQYEEIYEAQKALNKKDADIVDAKKKYDSKEHKPSSLSAGGSSMHTWSQDLNHKLNHGMKLSADEKKLADNLTKGLHPIGKNCTLKRAAHDTVINAILNKVGIKSYQGLSEQQLNTALVGTTFSMKSFGSFGAQDSKNPFVTGKNSGGREVILIAKTAASTKVISGAKDQAEFVTGIGQKMKITKVEMTGQYAYPKKGGVKPVINVYVDMW